MRNAVANIDDDFDDAPIKRRSPSARAKRGAKKKERRFNVDLTRVARYAAFGMSATVVLGIAVNALMLQKGHHPAPLFGKAVALKSAPTVPLPPPAPTRTAADTSRPDAPAADVTASLPSTQDEDGVNNTADDPIGRLLSGQPIKSAPVKSNGAGKPEGRTVLGVQKALLKLGFVVKANGTMTPATRKAIEAFEKDRHLPVKGDLSKRLVKVLSAESGIKID